MSDDIIPMVLPEPNPTRPPDFVPDDITGEGRVEWREARGWTTTA
jgi:hypothetical protein